MANCLDARIRSLLIISVVKKINWRHLYFRMLWRIRRAKPPKWMSVLLKSFNRSIHHQVSLCCRMSSNQAQTTQMNEHSNDLWLFNYPCITPHSALQPSNILKSCRVIKSLMVPNSVTSRIQMSGVTVSHSANIASWGVFVEGKTPFTLNTGDRREQHNEILLEAWSSPSPV